MSPAAAAVRVALVGDRSEAVIAHRAIPRALEFAGADLGRELTWTWVHTTALHHAAAILHECDAVWAVPATPYANVTGALDAIRFARETGRPFLGTCGGFQHALIEIARHVCGEPAADHAETSPGGAALVVTPLACALVEVEREIRFTPGSRLHAIFGGRPAREGYHCSYGPSPAWRERLTTAGLQFTGFDAEGAIRAGELAAHPFFVGTLFQPERSALRGETHPLITAFVRAVAAPAA